MYPVSPVFVDLPEDIQKLFPEIKVAESQLEYGTLPSIFLMGGILSVSRWVFDTPEEEGNCFRNRSIDIWVSASFEDYHMFTISTCRPAIDQVPDTSTMQIISDERNNVHFKYHFSEKEMCELRKGLTLYLIIQCNNQKIFPIAILG